jgi:acetyl esterase/lipase
MSFVAPEYRAAAAEIALQEAGSPPPTRARLEQVRNSPFFSNPDPLPDVEVLERFAPVGVGHPDVLLFVINARRGGKRPAILHTHGGGRCCQTNANQSLERPCQLAFGRPQ